MMGEEECRKAKRIAMSLNSPHALSSLYGRRRGVERFPGKMAAPGNYPGSTAPKFPGVISLNPRRV